MRYVLPLLVAMLLVTYFVFISSAMNPTKDCNILSSTQGDTRIPIASLSDNWQIQGSFFIGSGHIKQEPSYTFYVGNPSTGYQLKTIDATGVKIFTDENAHPYYLTKMRWVDGGMTCLPIYTEELHVPNNTIVKQYNLDGSL